MVLDLEDRPALTHNRGYHLLISIHMDAANNSKATGASIHFYSEYGYEAGQKLYDRVHAAETQYGVGTTAAGTPRAEPVRWNTLYINRMVHDMPSVLIECGFQTNKTDMECLIKPEYRDKLMQAVTGRRGGLFQQHARQQRSPCGLGAPKRPGCRSRFPPRGLESESGPSDWGRAGFCV